MKKRRLTIAAFLLAACLVIGFGFAALTTSLEVIGTAITHKDDNQLDAVIYFSAAKDNATYPDGTPEAEKNSAAVDSTDVDRATFTVNTLKKAGDSATFTFTIESMSVYETEIEATITNQTRSGSDLTKVYPTTLYTVTTDWTDNKVTLGAKTAGGDPASVTITITVTLNTNPTENIRGDFTLLFNATANGDPSNIPVTPTP